MSKRILQGFLFLNILIILYGYSVGFGKSLWFDEHLTIYQSRELFSLNLKENLIKDPNSSFFFFLYYVEKLLRVFNLNIDENINLIRVFNLIGIIPIALSFKILKKEKFQIDLYIVCLLLISSNYFFYYILEIRTYFLLLSFTFLLSVLNLTDTLEVKYKYLFIFSSIIISTFHIYGLTISMSILFYRFILNYYQKNYFKLKIDICIIALLFLIFFLVYWLNVSNPETVSKNSYLKFHLYYVGNFIKWNFNAVMFLFFTSTLIIFFKAKNSTGISNFINSFLNKFYLNILGQIIPIIILLTIILLVSSLITPIIHYRYFIVAYPGLILIGGLLSYDLFRKNQKKVLLFIFLTIITFVNINFYLKNILNSEQNIEWVVKKTFTKNCKDSEVYFNDDNRINLLNSINKIVKIHSSYSRPIKPLSKIDLNNLKINKDCNVVIFSFHTYNLEKNLSNINFKDLELKTEYAPRVLYKETSKAGAIVFRK
jgi:hypothetical protein